ncbi:MAG: phosphatidate cytidylyltransferase [Clostridia bacterium]|nr:phosphatidate cytidylyltransferase [Clostridia bacterium]
MWKDTLIRTVSAAVGLILFFIVIFLDPMVLRVAVGILSLMMVYETMHAFGFKPFLTALACLGSLGILLSIYMGGYTAFTVAFALTASFMAIYALKHHETMAFSDVSGGVFMIVYIICFMQCICLVRGNDITGLILMFMIFICAWISDTGAYFTGKLLGKHKLIEKISPKKTVEGAIGGVVFSALGGVILGLIAQLGFHLEANYLLLALTGMVGSVFGQVGDLIASWLKRQYGIKDFGNIMPGHGGAMDRFDSVVLAAPFVYFLVHYLPEIGLYLIR